MIAAIENAMLQQLRDAGGVGGLGYSFKTLESSPDDWEVLFAEQLGRVHFPAAWVGFTGWDATSREDGGLTRVLGAKFVLVVMSKILRNDIATRHGAGGEPGSYQLVLDATRVLGDFESPELAMMPLKPGAARQIARTVQLRGLKLSGWAIEFTTDTWLQPFAVGAEEPAPFEQLHVDWDVMPFGAGPTGEPVLPIPSDNSDASDDVTLEGAE